MSGFSSFTSYYSNLSNKLVNQVGISIAFDQDGKPVKPKLNKKWNALWDTGASGTCISKAIAKELNLIPVSQRKMHTPAGERIADCYPVHVLLPNHVTVENLCVMDAEIEQFDILIGMDIIGLGDFAVSNFEGKTVFSFRVPSGMCFDFIKKSYLTPITVDQKPGRNEPCSCGSGKKYKNCCGAN